MRPLADLLTDPMPRNASEAFWLTGYYAGRVLTRSALRQILSTGPLALSRTTPALTPARLRDVLTHCPPDLAAQVTPYWAALWEADPAIDQPYWDPDPAVVHPWEQACAFFWSGYGLGLPSL